MLKINRETIIHYVTDELKTALQTRRFTNSVDRVEDRSNSLIVIREHGGGGARSAATRPRRQVAEIDSARRQKDVCVATATDGAAA